MYMDYAVYNIKLNNMNIKYGAFTFRFLFVYKILNSAMILYFPQQIINYK